MILAAAFVNLIACADLHMGRAKLSDMPQHALMEILVTELGGASQFQGRDGEFEPLCDWEDLSYGAQGHVTKICMQYCSFSGTLKPSLIPSTVEDFSISNNRVHGSIDLGEFCDNVRSIDLANNQLSGSIALSALPVSLRRLSLEYNKISGNVDLTCLSPPLIIVRLAHNELEGEVDLSCLPETLEFLYLSHNKLVGSLTFAKLPEKLSILDLASNNFWGSLNLQKLPRELYELCLDGNPFTGIVHIPTKLPRSLNFISLRQTSIDGVADGNGPIGWNIKIWIS